MCNFAKEVNYTSFEFGIHAHGLFSSKLRYFKLDLFDLFFLDFLYNFKYTLFEVAEKI